MPGSPAEISVIIVNYGTADLALAAVESVLAREHGGRTVDVHLVDNASPGGDATVIAEAHAARGWGGRVTLYLEAENHGFGRGNNLVLKALAEREVPPSYVMLLNPDARLKGETIAHLADHLDQNSQAAIAGCGILRPDGSPANSVFRFPSLASEFMDGAQIGILSRLLDRYRIAPGDPLATAQAEWVSGAGFLARFEQLRAVGNFDPDFFLYFEEVELMYRLRKAGYQIWHVKGCQIEHVAGAATGMQAGQHRSRRKPAYWYESWRLYHLKTGGPLHARVAALSRLTGLLLSRGMQVLRPNRTAEVGALADFLTLGVRPLFSTRGSK